MSLFQSETVACPSCGKPVEFDAVYSLFADRRPDLRAGILNGTFQRAECPECGNTFRMEPEMSFVDMRRHQWVLVQPAAKLAQWPDLEEQATATFARAYGEEASPAARTLGRGMAVRVTFGWAALREKLLCADAGLDDVALELTKLALIRGLDDSPLADDVELRLIAVEGDELVFAWIQAATEKAVETLRAERGLYDEIAADRMGWKELREQLTTGSFVDVHRLLVPAA